MVPSVPRPQLLTTPSSPDVNRRQSGTTGSSPSRTITNRSIIAGSNAASTQSGTSNAYPAPQRQLYSALGRYPSGPKWQAYLAIPERLMRPLDGDKPALTAAEVSQQQKLLKRFERIARDERFRMVAQLPGFQETYAQLREIAAQSADAAAGTQSEPLIATGAGGS